LKADRLQVNNPGQVFAPRGELKREAGVNPARSRHCVGDVPQNMPLAVSLPGRLEEADEPKSGDLPVPVHQSALRKIGRMKLNLMRLLLPLGRSFLLLAPVCANERYK